MSHGKGLALPTITYIRCTGNGTIPSSVSRELSGGGTHYGELLSRQAGWPLSLTPHPDTSSAPLSPLGRATSCLWADIRKPSREKLCPVYLVATYYGSRAGVCCFQSLELLPNSFQRLALMSSVLPVTVAQCIAPADDALASANVVQYVVQCVTICTLLSFCRAPVFPWKMSGVRAWLCVTVLQVTLKAARPGLRLLEDRLDRAMHKLLTASKGFEATSSHVHQLVT